VLCGCSQSIYQRAETALLFLIGIAVIVL